MKGSEHRPPDNDPLKKVLIRDVHENLEESKQSVRELLKLRQSLYQSNLSGADVQAYRAKAIAAINQLFSDELSETES